MSERTDALAVALAYDHPGVPRVVAKGRGAVADKIVALARENEVPLEENAELAAALATIDLDQEIPVELYRAVAIVIGAVLAARKTSNW
jgi:flagellar biosynthesis protein